MHKIKFLSLLIIFNVYNVKLWTNTNVNAHPQRSDFTFTAPDLSTNANEPTLDLNLAFSRKLKEAEKTTKPIAQSSLSHDTGLITLNFVDLKIKAAFKFLAEFAGLNIVVSDAVNGKITLYLHAIPVTQALAILLASHSLGSYKIGSTIFIAPLTDLINFKKQSLQAQLEDKNFGPLTSELIQIRYAKAKDLELLLKNQNTTLFSARGKIIVDERTNKIWLTDTIRQMAAIKNFIKQLDIPIKQVLIEARIVNVTKDYIHELGIKFNKAKLTSFNSDAINDNLKIKDPSTKKVKKLAELTFDVATAALSFEAPLGMALGKLKNGILLDLELLALESSGQGEVVARPKLIVTNQQTATIESGEEVPYAESTVGGGTAVAFKKAVLSLKVTPQILPDAKILMDLKINQDMISPKVYNGVPVILTKEMQTNVLVNNGQTIVLGGIYKQDKHNKINRVPLLAKLPVLGILFKNQSRVTRNEEMLIFITPRIIPNSLILEDS